MTHDELTAALKEVDKMLEGTGLSGTKYTIHYWGDVQISLRMGSTEIEESRKLDMTIDQLRDVAFEALKKAMFRSVVRHKDYVTKELNDNRRYVYEYQERVACDEALLVVAKSAVEKMKAAGCKEPEEFAR